MLYIKSGSPPHRAARPHKARKDQTGMHPCGLTVQENSFKYKGKKQRKSERAFTVSCGGNSGNGNRAGRRIWSDNRQDGGIVDICPTALF